MCLWLTSSRSIIENIGQYKYLKIQVKFNIKRCLKVRQLGRFLQFYLVFCIQNRRGFYLEACRAKKKGCSKAAFKGLQDRIICVLILVSFAFLKSNLQPYAHAFHTCEVRLCGKRVAKELEYLTLVPFRSPFCRNECLLALLFVV